VIVDTTIRLAGERAAEAVPTGAASRPCAEPGPYGTSAAAPDITVDAQMQDGNQGQDQDASDMCRSCGACCSYSAEWPRFSLESEAHLDRIPRELVGEEERGMRCTGARCAALDGIVGRSTSCTIYPFRPDVCRACVPGDDACRQARRHFGLDDHIFATPMRRSRSC
jgi:uncharacterized protein